MRVPKRSSQSQYQFSRVPTANIERSSFDRSHGLKTTMQADYLVPVFYDEVLPGDTFSLRMSALTRCPTLIFPIMDNMYMDTFYFFVPNRLIWENWVKMMGERQDPDDSIDYMLPTVTVGPGGISNESLADYLGIPPGVDYLKDISALPFRAYNLIYNEWFRDQNLQDSVPVQRDDASVDVSTYTLLKRGKRHDYFTSCLPWPQKGDAVSIGLSGESDIRGSAYVRGIGIQGPFHPQSVSAPNQAVFESGAGINNDTNYLFGTEFNGGSGQPTSFFADMHQFQDENSSTIYAPDIRADFDFDYDNAGNNPPSRRAYVSLSEAAAVTINELRQAFQVQKMLEKDARGGTRYTEIILSHFGVRSPDARLQRPEYLGGGTTSFDVNAVAQTANSAIVPGTGTPQANLSAFGTSMINGHGFSKSFTEHGIILGLANIRADLTYSQGVNRKFTRRTRYDFYWPSLAHLGEQAVENREIFVQDATPGAENEINTQVFGYQERYAEYRYKPSELSGFMRPSAPTPLSSWHLSEDFATLPGLNSTFIQSNVPIDRVSAISNDTRFIFDAFFKLRCVRPMPMYGVPGLIDHF